MVEQYKYRFAKKYLKLDADSTVLEIGIGNDAPLTLKKYFQDVRYHGLDVTFDYNMSEEGKRAVDRFFQIDLEKNSLDEVPNEFYDYVIIAHVIEHVENGEDVLKKVTKKIKKGGGIYMEYPRRESARFPSMKGTLNFYDDPTHKRFYDIETLKNILRERNFEIIKSGVKRDPARIIGLPFMMIKSLVALKYLRGSVFWDLLGFAEYIFAMKKR